MHSSRVSKPSRSNIVTPYVGPRAASESRLYDIDEEVKKIVAEAYDVCKRTLAANRELVDEMVEDMIEKETLDYKELQDLVTKYYPEGIGEGPKMLPEAEAVAA